MGYVVGEGKAGGWVEEGGIDEGNLQSRDSTQARDVKAVDLVSIPPLML